MVPTDAELLQQYATERAEPAFAELVRRHLPLVYAVALRQVGGDAHLAMDVAQRVFTDLARKAQGVSQRPVLAGWLYRSTRFAASDVVRAERRRRNREREAQMRFELSLDNVTPLQLEQVRVFLDEVVAELGEADRDVLMLRFFERRSHAEIGAMMQVSEDAARMRVDRALGRIRAMLLSRGVQSTAGALGVALGQQVAVAVPAALASTITTAAMSATASVTGAAALTVAASGQVVAGSIVAGIVALAFMAALGGHRADAELRAATAEHDGAHAHMRTVAERLSALRRNADAVEADNARLRSALESATTAREKSRVAFVIDTSGSMRDPKTGQLHAPIVAKLEQVLAAAPAPTYFQVFDADGRWVVGASEGVWLPNDAATRERATRALRSYSGDSNSNPVPGIGKAVELLAIAGAPNSDLHVFVLGDEFVGRHDATLAQLEELNPPRAQGERRVTISAVAYATWMRHAGAPAMFMHEETLGAGRVSVRAIPVAGVTMPKEWPVTYRKYERVMRDITNRHGGTFETIRMDVP